MGKTTKEIPLNSGFHYTVNMPIKDFNIVNINEEKPNELLKFYPLSTYSVECLLNHQIYAAHPLDLNDPFDNFNQYLNHLIGINEEAWMCFYSRYGIISLAHPKNRNNILMWAHYTKHEGFAIVFNHEKLGFIHYDPYPMNYQNNLIDLRSIDKFELLDNKEKLLFGLLYFLTTKHKLWGYEKEYRILAAKEHFMKCQRFPKYGEDMEPVDRLISYKPDAINEIILGYEFIFKSDYYIKDKDDNILIKTNDKNRIDILSFLSSGNYQCSLIDIHPQEAFELITYNIKIEKINVTDYKIIRNFGVA